MTDTLATTESFWETQGWCLVNNVISVPIATILLVLVYILIKRHCMVGSFIIWWVLKKSDNTEIAHPLNSISSFYRLIKQAIALCDVNLGIPITNQGSPIGFAMYPCSKEFYRYTFHMVNALWQAKISPNIACRIQEMTMEDPSIKNQFLEEWMIPWNKSHELNTTQEEFDSFYMSYHDFMCIFHRELISTIRPRLPE